MSQRQVYLIGGAPLTGKSTLARALSKKRNIPWVSTDDIRKWMIEVVREEDYPYLFDGHDLGPDDFYKKFKTPQDVLNQQTKEGLDVQKGMIAMIKAFWWWDKFIVEGIAITPEFIRKLEGLNLEVDIKSIFLTDNNRENITRRLLQRGLWDRPETYPDYIKPIEVEWTILYNKYYQEQSKRYKIPIHDISKIIELADLLE